MSYDANGNTAECRIRRFCVCGFRVDLIADFNRIVCCPRKVLLSNIDKLCQQSYPWNVRTSEVSPMPMNISLTPHLEEMIREKIASGSYNSASEVVREALRLMEQEDQLRSLKLQKLRHDVQEGLDSGPSVVFDPREIKRLAREKKSAKSAK